MRQSGIVAAAGLHALDHHMHRLGDDHRNAERLADGLAELAGVTIQGCRTNMVFADLGPSADAMGRAAAANDILLSIWGRESRMVTHLDVSADDVEVVLTVLREAVARS